MSRRLPWTAIALLAFACAAPPNKEMDQAEGAIDAARAAGAERYAATEYKLATDALTGANTAVGQRDYRLALNHALESLEQAQNAARVAADTRARLRGQVERRMAETATLLAQASTRLDAARRSRGASRRSLDAAEKLLAAVNADVQEAGEAMKADDYISANPALDGVNERIAAAVTAIDAATTSQTQRRRR